MAGPDRKGAAPRRRRRAGRVVLLQGLVAAALAFGIDRAGPPVCRAGERSSPRRLALAAREPRGGAPASGASRHEAGGLAGAPSPYLRLHASDPVAWHRWSTAVFAEARREGKPVFLSIGYSSCTWCHVMQRQVFSDPEIAAFLNRHFVSILVDREARPDIDAVYMLATELLTGSGGWPNSLFLTPEGAPFYAGTSFPPRSREGHPGFLEVIHAIADAWEHRRDEVEARAQAVAAALASAALPEALSREAPRPAVSLARASRDLARDYDPRFGGFGTGPKFPRVPALELLLARARDAGDRHAREMLVRTLDAIALGGVRDPLEGGFYRYAVDPQWSLPHFERMLADNALLLQIYSEAFELTGSSLYRRVVEELVGFLATRLRSRGGGFFTAQDAETDGREGATYLWTRKEIDRLLGPEAAARFWSVYELTPLPNGGGRGVLRVRTKWIPLDSDAARKLARRLAELAPERARLLAARRRRPQPRRDEKILASWNGLAIEALAEAARVLPSEEALRLARQAARFVFSRLWDGHDLHHAYAAGKAFGPGVLEDYAYLARGLLALARTQRDGPWETQARLLVDRMLERLEDREGGGFYATPAETRLLVRLKPFADGSLPSPNGVALGVLQELAARSGAARYAGAAARARRAFAGVLEREPQLAPSLVLAYAASAAPRPATQAASLAPAPPSDVVQLRVRRQDATSRELTVELRIAPAWHINANPAARPELVPTTVAVEGAKVARVRNPRAEEMRLSFADFPLRVYTGRVRFGVDLATEPNGALAVSVRYQACDDRRCLAPAEARVRIAQGQLEAASLPLPARARP